jgi:hypothetical protein
MAGIYPLDCSFQNKPSDDLDTKINDPPLLCSLASLAMILMSRYFTILVTLTASSDFPLMDITEAEAEIKASQPDNEKLQSLFVLEAVGGEINILLGIKYLSHFQNLVHSLQSGLGIYEVRLSPSSPCITAMWQPCWQPSPRASPSGNSMDPLHPGTFL